MLKVYVYQGCSTCRNALKWLRQHSIPFEEIPIRENPPTVEELDRAIETGGRPLKSLFNVSGQDYRSLNLKDKLPMLGKREALELLGGNGNLVKRPFAVNSGTGDYLVGFKEEEWARALQ